MIEPNFAVYRHQLKTLKPEMSETDIYTWWVKSTYGNWHVETSPILGDDGKYHFIYSSVRDDGKLYVGKHSTPNLDDGYSGSGTEVKESMNNGHKFSTTPLCFFITADEAYAAEKRIVNNRFLRESKDIVLNKTEGGKGYPHFPKKVVPRTNQALPPVNNAILGEIAKRGFDFGNGNVLRQDNITNTYIQFNQCFPEKCSSSIHYEIQKRKSGKLLVILHNEKSTDKAMRDVITGELKPIVDTVSGLRMKKRSVSAGRVIVYGKTDDEIYDEVFRKMKLLYDTVNPVLKKHMASYVPACVTKTDYVEFWRNFRNTLDKKGNYFKASKQFENCSRNWVGVAVGSSKYHFEVEVLTSSKSIGVKLYIKDGGDKALFDSLEKQKAKIENSFGSPLSWQRKDNAQYSTIGVYVPVKDMNNVESEMDNVANSLISLKNSMSPFIEMD